LLEADCEMHWVLVATLAWSLPAPRPAPPAPALCVCPCAAAAVPAAPVADADRRVPAAGLVTPATETGTVAYGGPAAVSDFAAIALLGGGAAAESGTALLLGVAAYGLGAPLNHLAHGHPGRALASVGLRGLAAGAATGVMVLNLNQRHVCDSDVSCRGSIGVNAALASALVLTAMLVDDAWLARERVPAPPPRATLTPGLALGPDLAAVSLGGTF
jgi:hypothetical protein